MKEKLDIVIITYNRKDFLKKTFEQILAENSPIKDFDITILNNASDDGTSELVEEYQHTGLVLTQILILVAVGFHCLRFFQGELEVAKVGYMLKNFHVFI